LWLACLFAGLAAALSPRATIAQEPNWENLRKRFQDRPLVWGGDAEGGAPFQLRDPEDPQKVIGFEVELADAIAEHLSRRMGATVKAEFYQYDWGSLIAGLNRGDFDVIISGLEMTPENEAQVEFTRPYYIYHQQLVVRRDETQIESLRDCRERPMATLAGSAADRLMQASGVRTIEGFDGQVEPFIELELGRVDAVLLDAPIATYYAKTNPKLKFVGPPIGRGEYGIATRKEDGDLKLAFDLALSELMSSGRMQSIYRRWHLWNFEQEALARGANREAELAGLGFKADGTPVSTDLTPPPDAVNIDIIASAAEQWTFADYAPLLLQASGMTVLLTICSMALAMFLGLWVAVSRLYGPAPLRLAALAYVEFFRGIPLLLLLFFLYFGLSAYGFDMPAVATAILGFGLNYAAYEAEIYRSSIQSVPVGQWEAGRALGMSESLTFRRIIFPQAFRTALGPMTNDFVALFKDTSLVSVIAVRELTKEYLILSRSSLKFVELGLLTAALYLLMSVPLGYLSRYLEKRWGAGRH
jgi:polar amino acid transport system substrate-binding protein